MMQIMKGNNMKKQVRSSVFETNSSSTHAISVQTYPNIIYPKLSGMSKKEIKEHNNLPEVIRGEICKYVDFDTLPKTVEFKAKEFGWEPCSYDDYESKAAYLFAAMLNLLSYEDFDDYIKRITRWLNEEGISVIFPEYEKYDVKQLKKGSWYCYNYIPKLVNNVNCGVDDCYDLEELLAYVLFSKNHFYNYLFGDGVINTGNDNDDCDITISNNYWYNRCHKIFYKGC